MRRWNPNEKAASAAGESLLPSSRDLNRASGDLGLWPRVRAALKKLLEVVRGAAQT